MLKELLSQNKKEIVENWKRLIVKTYPESFRDTPVFLRLQSDQFGNPVGHIITESTESLFEELLNTYNPDKIKERLDYIIKLRAVQNFSPSEAVAFIFSLKQAIREELEYELKEEDMSEQLIEFESGIDKMALIAFDLYLAAREKIYQIRINELKSELFQKPVSNGGSVE